MGIYRPHLRSLLKGQKSLKEKKEKRKDMKHGRWGKNQGVYSKTPGKIRRSDKKYRVCCAKKE